MKQHNKLKGGSQNLENLPEMGSMLKTVASVLTDLME